MSDREQLMSIGVSISDILSSIVEVTAQVTRLQSFPAHAQLLDRLCKAELHIAKLSHSVLPGIIRGLNV